jgi:hypothetical protein
MEGAPVSDEPADQPLTGRARRLANLKPFVEGQSGNKSGRPKDLGRFGEILMKEFYRTVVASMGGKTVKKIQGEIVAQQMVRRGGGWRHDRDAHKTSKFHDDHLKTIDAAIEKAKATSGTSVDSAALELICLDYVGGQTLQERLAVLGPEALAKTFADVLNAISKDAATAVIKSIYQNVTRDIDLQAD